LTNTLPYLANSAIDDVNKYYSLIGNGIYGLSTGAKINDLAMTLKGVMTADPRYLCGVEICAECRSWVQIIRCTGNASPTQYHQRQRSAAAAAAYRHGRDTGPCIQRVYCVSITQNAYPVAVGPPVLYGRANAQTES